MRTLTILTAVTVLTTIWGSIGALASDNPNAGNPSQTVQCNQVDKLLAFIPHGNGDGTVTDDETAHGGWRYNSRGRSFVTFAHTYDAGNDKYVVDAGRSGVTANAAIINDYPATLDLPQSDLPGAIVFKGRRGDITLTGDTVNDPPLFALPGAGEGNVRINLHDPDGDGTFEGCAESPLLKNFGFVKPEGGDFVQVEFFKAIADVDASGIVTFFEWTEVSTFNNTVPGAN